MLCDNLTDVKEFKNGNELISSTDKHVIIALTTILFYSVFAYFIFRLRAIYRRNRISLFTSMPSFGSYLKCLCKITLEWAKAVVVVLCLHEQGLNYEPNIMYSILTFVYYLCTEKIFLEIIPSFIEYMDIERMNNLEHLYVPFFMNILTIAMGFLLGALNLLISYSGFVIFSLYFIVYLRIKDAYFNQWKLLIAENQIYQSFRVATQEDIEEWADICAVCLNSMSRARITPCNHLFHPHCLKMCLKSSFYCPLCKQHFMEILQPEK